MRLALLGIVLCIMVSFVMSIRIFPLPDPPSTKPPAISPKEYKKYSGLTAGLLPEDIAARLPKPIGLPANQVSSQVSKDGVQLARDLLPPKTTSST